MTTLAITRGYSGSGKTTIARVMVAEEGFTRVNRDDLRAMMGLPARGTHTQEERVTQIQRQAVRSLLEAGEDVVVDDTNLRLKFARDWADLAAELGAIFEVIDVKTDLDTCMLRDVIRGRNGGRSVGGDVIRIQASKFPISQWRPVTAREQVEQAWTPYEPPAEGIIAPEIYLVDIDGTLAKKRQGPGERGWYEYHRVSEDLPNPGVIRMVQDLRASGARIVFMSGRKDYCRPETIGWLYDHLDDWAAIAPLFMRGDDDNRSDDIVKHELFHEHIQGRYRVRGVIDDRDRVVAMWRAIGLTVAQVDYGNF